MEPRTNRSEVKQLLDQIEATYIAAERGLTGFAESARHAMITARMEHLGRLHEDLQTLVGDEAIHLIARRLELLPEEPTRPHQQGRNQ